MHDMAFPHGGFASTPKVSLLGGFERKRLTYEMIVQRESIVEVVGRILKFYIVREYFKLIL